MNRLPAEWEPQTAVMLTWPRADGDFAADYEDTAHCFTHIAASIARFQPVLISAHSTAQLAEIRGQRLANCPGLARIKFFCAPNNDVWARDHGPIGVIAPQGTELLHFEFNGWGGKYPADLDRLLVRELAKQGAFPAFALRPVPLVLEGGAIETDGQGTLLATRRSVLNANRNPDLTQQAIEAVLSDHLGIQRFLWLEHGALEGDDTDSHIDTLARFVSPQCIAYQQSGGPDDPNHAELRALELELQALHTAAGDPYALLPLPWPGLHRDSEGASLPAGYANFLIINGAVLMPTYGVDADREALARIAAAFPDRTTIGIDCRSLIRQHGSLHCVTMNLPA